MATMRELKRRLSSVQSSQKITGAMRMIASARLKKTESSLKKAIPYEEQLQAILNHLDLENYEKIPPLSIQRDIKNRAIVVFGPDEGLSGSYYTNLLKELKALMEEYAKTSAQPVQLYLIGKKLSNGIKMAGQYELRETPEAFSEKKVTEGIRLLSHELTDRFLQGEIDQVEILYTHFKSRGTQRVKHMQILPLLPNKMTTGKEQKGVDTPTEKLYYIYEPDVDTILDKLYPMILQTTLYKSYLESKSSEDAMRIISMQTANDNANKLKEKLQLEYNKIRQQNITSELLDLAGGGTEE